MLKREEEQRQAVEMLCTDMVVPKDHLLRKIDKAVDFKYIYTLVEDLYSPDNGRPSVDPVVLFKIVLIQHLFGIRSLRQTVKEIELNIGYRWFLGYNFSEEIPKWKDPDSRRRPTNCVNGIVSIREKRRERHVPVEQAGTGPN